MTPNEAYRRNFAQIDWSVPLPEVQRDRRPDRRSHIAAPMLIRDSLPDLKGMHDGKIYDSKSNMRAAYRQAGVREVETGEGVAEPVIDRISKAEVAQAVDKVKQGYKPAPLETSILPADAE